jgi:translation elongation factor EF-1alpha
VRVQHVLILRSPSLLYLIRLFSRDEKTVAYGQARYDEIKDEVSKFLTKVGYKGDAVPFVPVSGWHGDNLVERSSNMSWYSTYNNHHTHAQTSLRVHLQCALQHSLIASHHA